MNIKKILSRQNVTYIIFAIIVTLLYIEYEKQIAISKEFRNLEERLSIAIRKNYTDSLSFYYKELEIFNEAHNVNLTNQGSSLPNSLDPETGFILYTAIPISKELQTRENFSRRLMFGILIIGGIVLSRIKFDKEKA